MIESDPAFFDDAGDEAGLGGAGADGADAAVFFGDAVDLQPHFRGGEESVLPPMHGRAAGMRGLAVEGESVTLDAEGAEDGAQREVEIEQDGALLDVQLEISGGVFQFLPAFFHALEVDPVLFQCFE